MNIFSKLITNLKLQIIKMTAKYYLAIRPQTNEHHAVHKEGCPFLPDDEKRIYLGAFNSGQDAVGESKRHFIRTNSCQFCSKEHKVHDELPVFHKWVVKDLISAEPQTSLSYYQNLICCLN